MDRPAEKMALPATLRTPMRRHVPLGPRTWYGVGGPADFLAEPRNETELAELLAACHAANMPVHVLGKGANVLVAEAGVHGVVVQLNAAPFRQIDLTAPTVTAGGGADLEKLITTTARAGLAGLEGLAGIPASVGGAIRMNAGGRFGEIGPHVQHVRCMTHRGQVIEHDRSDLQFAYRRSNIAEPIILSATFDLTPGDASALRKRLKDVMAYKKTSQPMAARSAGCAFKNPPAEVSDRPAGRLIDEAGLKGARIGGAEVSTQHANFIVLHEGGTADDAIALLEHVQRTVAARAGITLEHEIVIWGT
jgi:UDP-N-acetylmuramate dehydrogenase